MTKEQAQEILKKIQNGTATDEEKLKARAAFDIVVKNIFTIPR